MLILIKWIPEDNTGLFRTPSGDVVLRRLEDLERNYLPFKHNSPKGEKYDIEIFIPRINF